MMDVKKPIYFLFGIFTLRIVLEAFGFRWRRGTKHDKVNPDLLFQILLKAPVKSLLRLKVVSKSFNALISSAIFEENFLREHSSHLRILILRKSDDYLSTSAHYLNITDSSDDIAFLPPTSEIFSFMAIGSYRGMVALLDEAAASPYMVLWNPSTGKYVAVPLEHRKHYSDYRFGLCYDRASREYKMVFAAMSSKEAGSPAFFVVVSFKTGQVTGSGEQHIPLMDTVEDVGITLEGVPHWSVRAMKPAILAFNHMENKFEVVTVRRGESCFQGMASIGVINGELAVVAQGSTPSSFEVWVTSDYKKGDSWTRMISFSTAPEDHFVVENGGLQPLGLVANHLILSGNRGRSLLVYDRSNDTLQVRNLHSFSRCTGVQVSLESPLAALRMRGDDETEER